MKNKQRTDQRAMKEVQGGMQLCNIQIKLRKIYLRQYREVPLITPEKVVSSPQTLMLEGRKQCYSLGCNKSPAYHL